MEWRPQSRSESAEVLFTTDTAGRLILYFILFFTLLWSASTYEIPSWEHWDSILVIQLNKGKKLQITIHITQNAGLLFNSAQYDVKWFMVKNVFLSGRWDKMEIDLFDIVYMMFIISEQNCVYIQLTASSWSYFTNTALFSSNLLLILGLFSSSTIPGLPSAHYSF